MRDDQNDTQDVIVDAETTDVVPSEPDGIKIQSFDLVVASVINESQFRILSGRTPKAVIKTRPGRGGKNFNYVPHGYVNTLLNRAFGFDWDFETLPNGNGDFWTIIDADTTMNRKQSCLVTGKLTVRIHDVNDPTIVLAEIVKTGTGERECIRGMTWGSIVKSAESDALKKCASKLGVALDLYWEDPTGEFIPESDETIAARQAEKMAIEIKTRNPGVSPKLIADTILEELGVDVPVNRVLKWIKEI
jgi:hypothetical protein